MDRQIILDLEKAERHVRDGAVLLQQQREILGGMLVRGDDVTVVKAFMAECEISQEMHIADRDRLLKMLAESQPKWGHNGEWPRCADSESQAD